MPGYKSEVPMTPSLDSVSLLKHLTELRKLIYSLDYRFITKEIKGYKQPDENIDRVRSPKIEQLSL